MTRGQGNGQRVWLREATLEDSERIWGWRNDAETRRGSFDEREIPFDEHRQWFEATLQRRNRRMYVVLAGGVEAGVVRLDFEGPGASVSINIAPQWREQGIGKAALRALAERAFGELGLMQLVARVKAENIGSRKVFEHAGFQVVRGGDPVTLTLAINAPRADGRAHRGQVVEGPLPGPPMKGNESPQVEVGSPAGLVLERVPCNLCGSDESRVMYRKPDTRCWISSYAFDAVRCRRCGLGFVHPRPTRESIRMFYPDSFYERRDVVAERGRYDLQAQFLDGYPRGRVLDIGCAGGAFLKVLQERGWQAFGMDLVETKNEYGLPIRYGELPELGYASEYFDAVTAWAVFEHLHDPKAYFLEVGRILKPGGHFVCLVTNVNSLWSRFAYAEDIPRHLYFYSRDTLRRYAALGGLRVERIDYSGRIFPPDSTDVFRVRLLRRLGFGWREMYRSPDRLPLAARVLARGARLLGVVLLHRRIESLLRIGGIMVAVMEKPR